MNHDSAEEGPSPLYASLGFIIADMTHSWDDLAPKSIEEIAKTELKFNDEVFVMNEIFPSNTKLLPETLNILSNRSQFNINPKIPLRLDFFVERKFSEKNVHGIKKAINIDDFIRRTKEEKISVISDLPGGGKTTLLHRIHKVLNRNYPKLWVLFVSLGKHKRLLSDTLEISEDFLELITGKILNFNELEKQIFLKKYYNNEIVILFDGFDEVSPACKENCLRIFQLHKKNAVSQIWITTRTHLKDDLEAKLKVIAYKLKPLSREERIEFLCKYWQNSKFDPNLIADCAEKLENKIKTNRSSLIGLTLQIRILAEYFEDKLSKDFGDKIRNLKISKVYEFLIENSVKFKEKDTIFNYLKILMRTYEVLALKYFLDDDDHHLFGKTALIEFEDNEELEEISRGGLVRYDEDRKVFFTYETTGEFFLSRFFGNRVKNFKNFKNNQQYENSFFELLLEILTSSRFLIVRMFLNEFIEGLWKGFNENSDKELSENVKMFAENFYKFTSKVEDFEWIMNPAVEKLSHLSFFLLKCLKFVSKEAFKKVFENIGTYVHGNSFFCLMLPGVHKENLQEFLDEAFELYPNNNELFGYLMRCNCGKVTIFQELIQPHVFCHEAFNKFWAQIGKRNFEYKTIKNFFFHRSPNGNILNYAFDISPNEDKSRVEAVIEIIQSHLTLDDQRKLFDEAQQIDDMSACGRICNEEALKKVFEYLLLILKKHEVLNYFKVENSSGETIWDNALKGSSPACLKVFINEFRKLNEHEENVEETVKNYIFKKENSGKNILMKAVSNPKNFKYVWSEVIPKYFNFKEFIFEVDNDGRNIFHILAKQGLRSVTEPFFNHIKNEFTQEELKILFKERTKKYENIFHCIAKDSCSFTPEHDLCDFFSSPFSKDEMREILSQVDSDQKLPLYYSTQLYLLNICEVFEDLYGKFFTETEILELKDEEALFADDLFFEMQKSIKDFLGDFRRRYEED